MARTYYFKDDEESKRYFDNERKMKENSQKWHETDDPDEKARLHFQNQVMSGENDLLDGGNRTFDDESGVWSVDYGTKAQSSVPWKDEKNNKFVSPYNDEIDALYDEIVNQKPFSYNPDTDPSYKAYENMYRREGDRASKSTLADIATAQGGVSSYAASAAQQAANAYAKGLTDKIPELEALAYQKFSADRNDKYNQLNSLMALDNNQYGRFIDERNFDYQIERDTKNDEYSQLLLDNENFWKQKYFDNDNYWNGVNQENWQLTREDNNYRENINEWYGAYDMVTNMINNGIDPSDEMLRRAGLTRNDVEAMKYYNMFGMYKNGGISSNGYSGGTDGKQSTQKKSTAKKSKTQYVEPEEEEVDEIDADVDKKVESIVNAYEKGTMTRHEAEVRLGSIEMSEWLKSR